MKNMFKFATNELTQDAFLMWLIEASDPKEQNDVDKDLYEASRKLIYELTGISVNEEILEVWTYPQAYKIDITAYIKTNKEEHVLYIEDKVMSKEHNQLEIYNDGIKKMLNKWKDFKGKSLKIHKIFYKIDFIEEDERNRVEKAGWKIYPFKDIINLFSNYRTTKNLFLRQYAEYINDIYLELNYLDIPMVPHDTMTAWRAFFINTVGPAIKDICSYWAYNYRFGYSYLGIRPLGRANDKIPYLEIRSRDVNKGELVAKILAYGVSNIEKSPLLADKIKAGNDIYFSQWTIKHNKQIGKTKEGLFPYKDKEEFIACLRKCINEYLKLIKEW